MGGAEEIRENINLSLRMNRFSRDHPLFRFRTQTHLPNGNEQKNEEIEGEELQLSLGLSTNGRFGIDPTNRKLRRSSSISNLVFTVGAVENGSTQPLGRACSLPTKVEEECHRRREMQSMKRMEARKKRMEKLKSVGLNKDKGKCSEDDFVNTNVDGIVNGSRKSSSSGFYDLQTQQIIEGAKQDAKVKRGPDQARSNELPKSAMLDMPFVSTKGEGPGCNKIEGFLYRYRKGEEVRIVCVCHGMFLSPAEFVKHGGGGAVEHPMKHIVVNPFPLF